MSTWKSKAHEDFCRAAVTKYGGKLIYFKPKDAEEWGLNTSVASEIIDFYTQLLGALAVFESGQRPTVKYTEKFKDKKGENVISRGLLQLSIESGNGYLKRLKLPKMKEAEELFDPQFNLNLGVIIMNRWIKSDGVIQGSRPGVDKDGKPITIWLGGGRYWAQFRQAAKIKAMKAHIAKEMKQETETMTKYDQVYAIAEKEIGVAEIKGTKHHPRILEYHAGTTYQGKTDEVPWCASFVDWCLKQMNEKSTNSAAAISFMKWGVPIKNPVKGCIVVFSRQGGNHVAFYHSETATHIRVLGGNQSNKVCLSNYPKSRFKGYRGFADAAVKVPVTVVTPTPAAKVKPTKEHAKALQRALNDMGASPKLKIDGKPGTLTKAACIQVANSF